MLAKPQDGKILILYLAFSPFAFSVVLIKEEEDA